MSEQQRLLIEDTQNLSEEVIKQIREYVAELKNSSVICDDLNELDNIGAPGRVKIKNREDLIEKLKAGREDIENGRVVSFEKAFAEAEKILAQ